MRALITRNEIAGCMIRFEPTAPGPGLIGARPDGANEAISAEMAVNWSSERRRIARTKPCMPK
jgi:hypothetical protein